MILSVFHDVVNLDYIDRPHIDDPFYLQAFLFHWNTKVTKEKWSGMLPDLKKKKCRVASSADMLLAFQ